MTAAPFSFDPLYYEDTQPRCPGCGAFAKQTTTIRLPHARAWRFYPRASRLIGHPSGRDDLRTYRWECTNTRHRQPLPATGNPRNVRT